MAKEFIEQRHNSKSIQEAAKQEKQINYFTNSKIQEDRLDEEYLSQWAERKYQTNDYFLNWVKSIFKTDNFLSFYKHLRYPLPSANIIKNKIEPQLRRVFNSEDSYFNYDVNGKNESDYVEDLKIDEFNNDVFRAILYNFNSIMIADLSSTEVNKAFRYLLSIDKVVSLDECKGVINRIAYTGSAIFEGVRVDGYIYIDSTEYALYDRDYKLITSIPHDLGHCPAKFIIDTPFKDDYIVKESLFSFIRPLMEDYNFYGTLLRMTEVNGAFPVVSMLDTEAEPDNSDIKGQAMEPNTTDAMASQRATVFNQNAGQGEGDLQPGTLHKVNAADLKNEDGSINMDVVKSFINFYHMPVDILNYINDKVAQIESRIIASIVGDVVESSEESKNELQISKSISVLENILNSLSTQFNRIRKLSDIDILGLQFGINNIRKVSIHYGTDFFLETRQQLINELKDSPNVLERKNTLVRMNQNRYKNNQDTRVRNKLLYDILPYVSDKDFDLAKDKVDIEVFQLQTRFNYWISQFEALYGDIVVFFQDLDTDPAQKLKLINELIIKIIKENSNESTGNLVRDN